MKYVGIFILIIFGVIAMSAIGIGLKILFFPVNTAQKMIDTAYDAQNKTLNADNAIYNYEWFKQTKEDIEAIKRQYDNACMAVDTFKQEAGDRSKWTFEDKDTASRLDSVKLGLQNNLEQIIANYNARAQMANRNIFENSILPSYLDALTFIKK